MTPRWTGPDSGIVAGTSWEDVPEDWVCPVCRLSKDSFTEEQYLIHAGITSVFKFIGIVEALDYADLFSVTKNPARQ